MWKTITLEVECIVCKKSLYRLEHNPEAAFRRMGKIIYRRSRSANWSANEKKCLLELIQERRAVLMKVTSGASHKEQKYAAWNEILREMANRFGNKFKGSSTNRIKTQWQNMKRLAREEVTLNGSDFQKYTSQSLSVCNILDIIKDGVLVTVPVNSNTNALNGTVSTGSNCPNIEIKTERIDEEQADCGCSTKTMQIDQHEEPTQDTTQPNDSHQFECSSSISEQNSEMYESKEHDPIMKSVAANTDPTYFDDISNNVHAFYKDYYEFRRFTKAERQIKVENLKEERQIFRAMRETAELNKIIAEQRLKYVLFIKKREIA